MTPDDVIRASNAWTNVPDDAPIVETEDYLLVRFPDHYANPLELVRFTPQRPVPEVVAEVLDRARGFAVATLVWRLRLDSPAGVEPVLRHLGGTIDETLDVFALDLTGGLPDLGSHEVDLRWATDVATTRDALGLGVEVFGGTCLLTSRCTGPRRARRSPSRWAAAGRSSPIWTAGRSAPAGSRRAGPRQACGVARCSTASAAAGSTARCSPRVSSTPWRTT